MKNLLLSLMLILPTLCYGQTLEGFLGIKFGLSADSIKKVMLLKPGCKFDQDNSKKDLLVFKGITFAGREVQFVSFEFVNNKFYTGATVTTPSPNDFKILNLYKDIRSDLNTKYFNASKTVETYDSPYKKGDGNTETAIKLGKTNITSYWYFKNPKSNRKDIVNSIVLSITYKMTIKIVYQDGVLNNEAVEMSKKKNVQDY
jgi:hypothetical protein